MTLAPELAWDGVANRFDSWSFPLLDPDGNPTGDEIHPDTSGMSMSVDGNATVPRSVRGLSLVGDEANDIDPISARVRPTMTIGGVDYPLGILLFVNVERPRSTRAPTLTATLVDQSIILDAPVLHAIGFNQGALISSAIAEVAALYPVTVDIVISTATLPGPVGWPPGTSGSRIIADLCEAAAYLPLHFDNDGLGRVRPPSVSADHTYGPGTIVINESPTDNDDLLEAYNTFVVTGGSGDNPAVGVYEVPSSAPQSIANRGFPVTFTKSNAAIGTPAEARAVARDLATTMGLAYRTIDWETTPNPTHDIFDVVDMEDVLYLETGWRLPMDGKGDHSHSAVRIESDE